MYEFDLKFMAWDDGLVNLGGLRVLLLDGAVKEGEGEGEGEGDELGGNVVREWESLGDVLVSG